MTDAPCQLSGAAFVPWRDGSLLPEESTYSLVNKVSWFLAQSPIRFARACNTIDGRKTAISPKRLDFTDRRALERYFSNQRLTPRIHGLSFADYLRRVRDRESRENTVPWRARGLRVCVSCIAMGVHLRLHQHTAVSHCPLHGIELESKCPYCKLFMSYCVESDQGHYCCPQCHRSLLHEGRVATVHDDEFRSAVNAASSVFEQWRMRALLDVTIGCGVERIEVDDEHPLQDLAANRVLLAARCGDASVPAWVGSCNLIEANVQVGTIRIAERRRDSTFRSITESDVAAVNRSVRDLGLSHRGSSMRSVDGRLDCQRYRTALRRVTSYFLSRYGPQHTECLDTPFRMFGENLTDKDAPEELLQCCPVAIGFWLWRLSSSNSLEELTCRRLYCSDARFASVDLVLYSLAKSHLHYLIYLANTCAMRGRESAEDRHSMLGPIRAAISQIRMCWHPIEVGSVREGEFGLEGACHCVKFDCAALIARIECSGSAPYVCRLRRQLRNTLVMNPRNGRFIEVNLEPTWEAEQFQQVRPFALMKHDRMLLSEAKFMEPRADLLRMVNFGGLSSRVLSLISNDQWFVLDTAISSNLA